MNISQFPDRHKVPRRRTSQKPRFGGTVNVVDLFSSTKNDHEELHHKYSVQLLSSLPGANFPRRAQEVTVVVMANSEEQARARARDWLMELTERDWREFYMSAKTFSTASPHVGKVACLEMNAA